MKRLKIFSVMLFSLIVPQPTFGYWHEAKMWRDVKVAGAVTAGIAAGSAVLDIPIYYRASVLLGRMPLADIARKHPFFYAAAREILAQPEPAAFLARKIGKTMLVTALGLAVFAAGDYQEHHVSDPVNKREVARKLCNEFLHFSHRSCEQVCQAVHLRIANVNVRTQHQS